MLHSEGGSMRAVVVGIQDRMDDVDWRCSIAFDYRASLHRTFVESSNEAWSETEYVRTN